MATIKPELKTILDRYGINPRDTSQIWDCRGTLVLYHKAYEIIAAKESIAFDPPQVVRGNKDEAVILVTGRMGDRAEWSFGEAVIGQNYQVSGKQAAYPYAMAEKRAKDRVIAKLVGLAQYVYSEDEAEDFKTGERKPVEEAPRQQDNRQPPPQQEGRQKPSTTDFWAKRPYAVKGNGPENFGRNLCLRMKEAASQEALTHLWDDNENHIKALPEEVYKGCQDFMGKRMGYWSQHPTGKAA